MNVVRHDERPHGKTRIIIGIVAILLIFGGFFYTGYGLMTPVYGFTGRPPEGLAHVFSAMTGITLFGIVTLLFNGVRRRRGSGIRRHFIASALMDAIDHISRGDFEILINMDEISPQHHEVAEAINDMARNLGTLETMRQDFISNVSHEIQSPLTSISGFAALLKKTDLPDDKRQRYAEIIEAESKRLSSLSDNLLKLSSLDNKIPLTLKEFRLDKQLERIALTLEPQWSEKNIVLEADLQKVTVNGDEDLLSQVWMNLLHNAIKFTPEGGQVNITLTSDGKSVRIIISDTGVGIAPEDQMHIFGRFYKVDKARDRSLGGNGLGLSLVKKIVELHGGNITVESDIGKGTTLKIRLKRDAAI